MIEQDPSRYGKNEIPPMLLEQQPPNNPPQCQNTCFSSSCPPMVTLRTLFPASTSPAFFYKALAIYYDKSPEGKGKHSTLGEKQRASTPR